jgi:AraC-like DNA-binding protein
MVPLNTGFMKDWLPYLSICVLTLVCAYSLLRGRNGVLFGIPAQSDVAEDETVVAMAIPELKDQQYTAPLETLMEQGFYRTEHLTLKMLATELTLPEYKTRALINQTMGYRNFSDYINQLRIKEAASHLLREPNTPILNISLDVGYRTLSSFNRAFKDIKNMSPSEYRAQAPSTALA